jgi:hypothetical protein
MADEKIYFDLELTNKIFKSNMLSLINVSKDSIKDQKKQYEIFIDKLSQNEVGDDWLDQSSHYANIEWILLNSIFLSSFSFFEHHIYKLCSIVEDRKNGKIKLEHISGKGITKFCNYLFLVGEIEAAKWGNSEWQNIIFFQKVRNLIAHNGGILITEKTKKLENHECYKFLKKYDVIMLGHIGHIRMQNLDFIEAFRELTTKLSDILTKEITEKFKKKGL